VLVEFGLDRVAVSDKQDAEIEVTYGRQRPVYDMTRRLVAAHCVDCDPDHRRFQVPGSGFQVRVRGSRTGNSGTWNRGTWNL
jgi:hypothetical protein